MLQHIFAAPIHSSGTVYTRDNLPASTSKKILFMPGSSLYIVLFFNIHVDHMGKIHIGILKLPLVFYRLDIDFNLFTGKNPLFRK